MNKPNALVARCAPRHSTDDVDQGLHELILNLISDDGEDAIPTIRDLFPHMPAERVNRLVETVCRCLHRASVLTNEPQYGLVEFYGKSGTTQAAEQMVEKELAEADEEIKRFIADSRDAERGVA